MKPEKKVAKGTGTATPLQTPPTAPTPKARPAPLWFPLLPALLLGSASLLPRFNSNATLKTSVLAAAAFLLAGFVLLLLTRGKRILTYEFVPRRVHWVQMCMHSSVYAYWGYYWREVYHEIPLILSQVLFLIALDMIVCWLRRDKWILGFGPIPIIFSTNLFLWFRDDWYYLQYVLVAIIVLGKEFVRWKRDGQSAHIFNPSAFALFLTSIVLIATNNTPMTWGIEISTTFTHPPNFYLEIFLVGLIVQSLFAVTLVTLTSALTLALVTVGYLTTTGIYPFIDTNIHPAVFLGLHLLVTDPATSPRKNLGKAIFGVGYGLGVWILYEWLNQNGQPEFYDKLLCVPVLNLTVRWLDRVSIAVGNWFSRQRWIADGRIEAVRTVQAWSPQQLNFAFMGVWVALFGVMAVTGFLGGKHPGSESAFWESACGPGKTRACQTLAHFLDVECQHNSSKGCFGLGNLLSGGRGLPADPPAAARSLTHACDMGIDEACGNVANLVKAYGDGVLLPSCTRGDGLSCFMLGSLYYAGNGVARSLEQAAGLFQQSCTSGFFHGCGQLGESYLFGEGLPRDEAKAKGVLEKACTGGYGPGCFNLAVMHRRGIATPQNELLAQQTLRRACELGYKQACEGPAPPVQR